MPQKNPQSSHKTKNLNKNFKERQMTSQLDNDYFSISHRFIFLWIIIPFLLACCVCVCVQNPMKSLRNRLKYIKDTSKPSKGIKDLLTQCEENPLGAALSSFIGHSLINDFWLSGNLSFRSKVRAIDGKNEGVYCSFSDLTGADVFISFNWN